MHVSNNGSPLYLAEANMRMQYYPSPWYTPWLYCDGGSNGSSYSGWRNTITTKMNRPAPMTQTMWGTYNSVTRTGTIYAKYRNDTTTTITARIYFVITEDSCYYVGSNGDPWHNHVARDYLPTQVGVLDTIAVGDSTTQSRSFTLSSTWNVNRCKIISWIQWDAMRWVYNGGVIKVSDLTGVEEHDLQQPAAGITLAPNPCLSGTTFRFQIPLGNRYTIKIFDVSGRIIRTMSSVSHSSVETCAWNLRADHGDRVNAGVYLYTFESEGLYTSGKIVVK